MVRIVPVAATNESERSAVGRLLDSVTAATKGPPLSDHLLVELRHPQHAEHTLVVLAGDDDRLSGIAVLQPGNGSWSLETVLEPGDGDGDGSVRQQAVQDQLFAGARRAAASRGGGSVTWWRLQSTPLSAMHTAVENGFALHRELHQMRRPLPIADTTAVSVRAFRPGRDDAAWLRVNNRAFADHAEQGGWDQATLAKRMAEPWFDAAGFLLHERDGVLAAFCWTKVHDATEPPMGEIYAIAVDPAFHGLGLGRALTVSGLHHLGRCQVAGRALGTAMLHVDGGNTAAVGLYESLGFEIDHTDQAYIADVPVGPPLSPAERSGALPIEPSATEPSATDALPTDGGDRR